MGMFMLVSIPVKKCQRKELKGKGVIGTTVKFLYFPHWGF